MSQNQKEKGRIATRDDLPPALFRNYNSPVSTWREFLPIQPYPWQYALWSSCWEYGAEIAMRTCNEAGKPQPHDTIVPTPDGWRRFGDLKIGDRVFDKDGNIVIVTYIFEQGFQDVYKITFDNGEVSTLVTGDHAWWYLKKSRRHTKYATREKFQVYTTDQIIEKQGNRSTPQNRGCIPACKPVKYHSKRLFIKPYTMGSLLGDGCFRNSSIGFTSEDKEIVDRLRDECREGFELVYRKKYTYQYRKTTTRKTSKIIDELRSYGLMGADSSTKFIPDDYMFSSVNQRIDLLRGLMDTDGRIDKRKCVCSFTTISPQLSKDICSLIRSLGGKAATSTRTTFYSDKAGIKTPGKVSYRTIVKLPEINPFWLPRKAKLWYPIQIRKERLVYDIIPVGQQKCRCIKVDSPSSSYLTNDYIVTHNSSYTVPVLACAWAAGFPGSQCVITSSSDDQLQEQLWPVLKSIANRKGWRTAGTTVELPSVDNVLPGSKIICRVTKEGGRFEGYHNRVYPDAEGNERFCPLLMIYDEAKTIKPEIFEAGERCNAAVNLRISTVGDDSGDFHDSCMSKDWITGGYWQEEWFDYKITWEMCPHLFNDPLTYRRKMKLINEKGRNHPFVMSNLFAEFFRSGTHKVFTESDINAALRAMNEPRQKIGRIKKAFCDFSGGGDKLTFGHREGNYIAPIVSWNREGHVAPSEEGKKYSRLIKDAAISDDELFGDNGGLGAGIISEIKKLGHNMTRVNANQSPRDRSAYVDLATEMYWEYKQALHDDILILPKDDELITQMKLRRYVMKNSEDNKIRLEPKEEARKKRNEKSPDVLETVVNLVHGMESLPTMVEIGRGEVRTGVPSEYFKRIQQDSENENSSFGEEWE